MPLEPHYTRRLPSLSLSLSLTLSYWPHTQQAQESLLDAAESGDDEAVHSLLAANVNPNAADVVVRLRAFCAHGSSKESIA